MFKREKIHLHDKTVINIECESCQKDFYIHVQDNRKFLGICPFCGEKV
jgi:Zn finger protein HypA/HybF involved in hydrogenase expression